MGAQLALGEGTKGISSLVHCSFSFTLSPLPLTSASWNGWAPPAHPALFFARPALGTGSAGSSHRQQELRAASSTNSLVLVVHHLHLQRWHCFQSIHKLGRKIKTQGFGAFPQLIAPLHSWPGEGKTNFYWFYLHKSNVFAILPEHKLCAAVEASAEDSPAEKAQILCSVCSATELLHHTSLSFSLHKVGMIIPINFCQALTVKNESRYENIK